MKKDKTPEEIIKEWSLVSNNTNDYNNVRGYIEQFRRQCFKSAKQESSQENDWVTDQDFDQYIKHLNK